MASLSDSINTLSANDRMLLGNVLLTQWAKAKTLKAIVAVGGKYATPREYGVSSGYVVPTGKKFVVVSVERFNNGGATNEAGGLQAATSDVGFQSAAAPTGEDYPAATAVPTDLGFGSASNSSAKIDLLRTFPAGKYLSVYVNTAATVHFTIVGFEIDASATTI